MVISNILSNAFQHYTYTQLGAYSNILKRVIQNVLIRIAKQHIFKSYNKTEVTTEVITEVIKRSYTKRSSMRIAKQSTFLSLIIKRKY